MAKILAFYESQFPSRTITNAEQVFIDTGTPYPERWHHYFRAFGKHAGFKNSVFEKYVLVPSIRHPAVTGELVMLNATAFPNDTGAFGRVLVSKTGTGVEDWMQTWFPEEEVQRIFQDAGQTIPKPVPMAPPPDVAEPEPLPLGPRVERYFVDVAVNLGVGSATGRLMMWSTFALFGITMVLLLWLVWSKSR
jgi:hypothetical protein